MIQVLKRIISYFQNSEMFVALMLLSFFAFITANTIPILLTGLIGVVFFGYLCSRVVRVNKENDKDLEKFSQDIEQFDADNINPSDFV